MRRRRWSGADRGGGEPRPESRDRVAETGGGRSPRERVAEDKEAGAWQDGRWTPGWYENCGV